MIGATAGNPAAANITSSGGSITITNGANTINIESGASVPTSFAADTGTAVPSAGVLTLAGGTNGIDTVASGSTVTFNFDVTEQPTIPVSIVTDSGTCTPAANSFSILGGAGIDTSASGSTITIVYDGSEEPTVPTSFPTDSGTAVPALNALQILGGIGIGSTGSGNTVTLNLDVPVTLANGGTNASLTASNGGIFYSTSTAGAILSGTATATQMLQSGASGAPAWSTSTWPATTTVSQLLYSSATNTVSGLATANRGVLTTGATGVPVITALATDGQVIIGSTAGAPAAATLTAGSGVSITNGSNSITIAAGTSVATTYTGNTGSATPSANNLNVLGAGGTTVSGTGSTLTITSGGLSGWVEETTTSRTLTINQGVICNNAGLVTCTLPAAAAQGSVFHLVAKGAGFFRLAQGSGQQVRFGSVSTTSGAGGSITATAVGDVLEVLCTTANTGFTVLSSMGSLTIV